jgi:hypothetical protein
MTIQSLKQTKEEQKMLDDIEREPNTFNLHSGSYVEQPAKKELDKIVETNVDTRNPNEPEVLLEKEVAKEKLDKQVADITKIFTKVTNPLDVNIKTMEVEKKTVEGYFTQISHNFYIGAKAIVFMCRDIAIAKKTLTSVDYDKLKEFLEPFISRTTVTKYENIGQCDRLYMMLQKNLLPLQWTTQYQLSKLSDDDWKKVESHLTSTTTMDSINELLGNVKDEKSPTFAYTIDNPKDVIRIAVSRGTQDAIKMTMLSQKIQKVIDELNLQEVNYNTRIEDIDFVSEMSVDTKFITETDDKTLKFFKGNSSSPNIAKYSDAKKLCPSPYLRKDLNTFMSDEKEVA